MGVCTHEEVYPTDEVLSSLSELEMSTTDTIWDAGKGLTRSSGSLECGDGRLTIETICGGSKYGTRCAGALCTGVRGDAGVQDNAADWCEGVVEEDVTNNVTGDNHCAEGWDGIDLVCDDYGVTCWVWAQGRDCPTGALLLLLCNLPAWDMVPPSTISFSNNVTLTYVDLGALPWLNVEGWRVVEERGLDDDGSELGVLMGWAGNDETSEPCWALWQWWGCLPWLFMFQDWFGIHYKGWSGWACHGIAWHGAEQALATQCQQSSLWQQASQEAAQTALMQWSQCECWTNVLALMDPTQAKWRDQDVGCWQCGPLQQPWRQKSASEEVWWM